jgi:hypothetical protein
VSTRYLIILDALFAALLLMFWVLVRLDLRKAELAERRRDRGLALLNERRGA